MYIRDKSPKYTVKPGRPYNAYTIIHLSPEATGELCAFLRVFAAHALYPEQAERAHQMVERIDEAHRF